MCRMRILCVTTKLCAGGVQSFLVSYAKELVKFDVWMDFVVQTNEQQVYDDELKQIGCKILPVCPYSISKYRFLKDIYVILKRNKKYSIIHTHLNYINVIPLFAAFLAKCPVRISHSHSNYIASSIKTKILRFFAKSAINYLATDFWACSRLAARWLYGDYENVQIIGNSVDYNKFSFDVNTRNRYRKNLGIPNSHIVWLHVGAYSRVKNQCFILRVLKDYVSINNNVKLILCGDGDLSDEINTLISQLSLQDYIIQLGTVKNVNDYLQVADIFVFPSLFEGLPFAVIEAQTSGLPVVVSKAIPDEALFGNFLKCETFNVSEWIKNINKASCCERELDVEYFYNSGFSLEHESKRLSELYKSLV